MDGSAVAASIEPGLKQFARRLQDDFGAERVLLFGSRARGDARPDSDYDVLVVAPTFCGIEEVRRPVGLCLIFYQFGIHAPVDLFCLTPQEFPCASSHITLVNAVLPEAIDLLAEPAERTDDPRRGVTA